MNVSNLTTTAGCNAPPPRSPGDFVYEPVGRDPLGSTKKRIKYTAKRTIVIQTDRCAFKTQNSSLPRPFCSNRLLFGDGDFGDGDGRCGVVDFFIILLSPHVTTPQLTAFQTHSRTHHHCIISATVGKVWSRQKVNHTNFLHDIRRNKYVWKVKIGNIKHLRIISAKSYEFHLIVHIYSLLVKLSHESAYISVRSHIGISNINLEGKSEIND